MPEPRKPGANRRHRPKSERPTAGPRKSDTPNQTRPPVGQGRNRLKTARPAQPTAPQPPNPAPAPVEITLPNYDPPDYVRIARIATPFGLRGAVKATIDTDFPERFEQLKEVFLSEPGSIERVAYPLLSARAQNEKQVVLRFSNITKVEQAETLRGYDVTIPRSEVMPLPEGEYYIFQIIGLDVYSTQGEYVGKVVNVENLPANDIYVVRGPLSKNDVLLPAIKDVIQKVDLEAGRITVDLLDGLI